MLRRNGAGQETGGTYSSPSLPQFAMLVGRGLPAGSLRTPSLLTFSVASSLSTLSLPYQSSFSFATADYSIWWDHDSSYTSQCHCLQTITCRLSSSTAAHYIILSMSVGNLWHIARCLSSVLFLSIIVIWLSLVKLHYFTAQQAVCSNITAVHNNNNNNATYIAQIRKAANALLRVSVKQECFQSISECGQR